MFGRVESYLQENLHLGLHAKLIHGQAFLIKDDLQHIQTLPGGNDQTSPDLSWFAPRKRALLAPFGVGTIDQAELGALNVRHFALRMAGLAGKVLILDEVHAYDMYMTAIIERLLKWLACLGTSVILLSATLPSEKRKSLMAAYGIENPDPLDRMQTYPSLWVGSTAGVHHTDPPVFQPDRKIKLEFLSLADNSAVQKAHWLVDHTAQGGCICWIINTVQRAQELFEAVDSLAPIEVQRLLIHSQFPLNDRQRLETLLTQKYGPPATGTERPLKSIVIGTQVLEQSLDLDFDLMVTDLAPMDLIFQRAGRLQRHVRTNRCSVYPLPCLYIYHRSDEQDQLDTHIDDRIYYEYILQKTWQALKGREWLYLPADYRSLIEAVYDPQPPALDDSLYPAWKKLHCGNLHDRSEAEIRLVPVPNPHDSICKVVAGNDFVESETRAGWIVAQTRLGERSVTVVPLVRQGKQARLPGREENWLDISCPTDRATELKLLQHQLHISRWNAVKALESAKLPPLFSHSTLLKDFIPLWLDEQQQASLAMEKTVVHFTLDDRLGLVIR
jgi:CRISPR-associated endonuclease/helicase Cas3